MTFLYEQTHYEIYVYVKPSCGVSLLVVQVFADDARPVLPRFLPISEEVTGDPEYSAYNLSVQPPGGAVMSPRTAPLPHSPMQLRFTGDGFEGEDFALDGAGFGGGEFALDGGSKALDGFAL